MSDSKTTLGGFDLISDMFVSTEDKNTNQLEFEEDFEEEVIDDEVEDDDDESSNNLDTTVDKNKKTIKDDDEDDDEDDDDEEDDDEDEIENKGDSEEIQFDDEIDKDISSILKDKFEKEYSIVFDEEEDSLDSLDGIVKALSRIVEESSKPLYANEEVQKYDEFVRNGGNLLDFYSEVYSDGIDPDKIDLEDELNQKLVIREHLKTKGYKDANIDKRLVRYEESGVLEDEAIDALELLKEYKENKKEKLLENQKKEKEKLIADQQNFIADVQKTIDEMSDIRGIPLTKQEKVILKEYMFKPGKDGLSDYQREYTKNVKNLVESAFFTKNGDSLIKKAKDKAASETYKKLQKKINERKGKRQSGSTSKTGGGSSKSLEQLSSLFVG